MTTISRRMLRLLVAMATWSQCAHGLQSNSDAQKPLQSSDYVCEHPPYQVRMVSKSPLVIYITDFLTPQERLHLQEISQESFIRSHVAGDSASSRKVNSVRTSRSTNVPRDAVVRCIEDRALAFQGYDVPRTHLEPVQLVRYETGERYHFHTDWFTSATHTTAHYGGNRASSFFAYVAASNGTSGAPSDTKITGGGTNFPMLEAPRDERWCSEGIVDCDEEWDKGVTFRPVEGNAVYWENLLSNGMGDQRVMHAGLPVTSGWKIGMNIWTREAPVSEEIRGHDTLP